MTDDLVTRLRDACRGGETCKCSLNEAADRIEELERERDEAKAMQECACSYDTPTDVCVGHHRLFERLYAVQRGKLEARLAKAMEALTAIAADASVPVRTGKNGINHKKMYKGWRKIATTRIDIARTTLAEIEGGKTDD